MTGAGRRITVGDSGVRPSAQAYAALVRNFMRANLTLGRSSSPPRYQRHGVPGGSLTVTDTTQTAPRPLPYPSVAWWWTV